MSVAFLTAQSDHASSTYAVSSGANFFSVVSDASDGSYAYGTDNYETVDQWWFECEYTDMPTALAINSVTVSVRAINGSGLSGTNHVAPRIKSGGSSYNGGPQATGAVEAWYPQVYSLDPATGLLWTPAGVNAARFGSWYDVTGFPSPGARISPEVKEVQVSVDYVPLPPDQGATRDAASRKLFLRRAPGQYYEIKGGLWLLDFAHLDAIDINHLFGVSGSVNGFAPKSWQRGMMAVHKITVDPMTNEVTLRLRNERRLRCWLFESGWAKQAGAAKNGLMRLSNGASVTFARASTATVVDAAGDTVVVQQDVEAFAAEGQDFQPAAGARAADIHKWSNDTGARTWPKNRSSSRWEVTPDWSAAAVTTLNLTVFWVTHDANNYAWLYFDGANARWVFELKIAGSTYQAIKAASPVAGTRYVIGTRATGRASLLSFDLDLAEYTASIFIDGVKGTDVIAGGSLVESASSFLYIGSRNGSDSFKGKIRRRIVRPIVLIDKEMARSFS